MVCNCIKEIEERMVEKDYADPEIEVCLVNDERGKKPVARVLTFCRASYKAKKRNGEFMKSRKYVKVFHSHCPFCGQSYREECDGKE